MESNHTPRSFVSYSWVPDAHKNWVQHLATRLRGDGIDVALDQWETAPGDQLPEFMERAVRENDYVLILCTPEYKVRSDGRHGGVGYEGDIMTAELLRTRNARKFIPVLCAGTPAEAIPTWLDGRYYVDLRGQPFSEEQYHDLLMTLQGTRPKAPPVGKPARGDARPGAERAREGEVEQEDGGPIRIEGIAVDEVGKPRNDGTEGSALYAVPFKLTRPAPNEWAELFVRSWDHPPRFTTMHRPGIARVYGDRVILDGTTVAEVERYHRDTLKLVLEEVNRTYAEIEQRRARAAEERRRADEAHRESVEDVARRIRFDD